MHRTMTLEEALRRFAATARPEILRDHAFSSCIASTWIAIQVFGRLGFRAEALEVVVSVGNGAYSKRWHVCGPPKSEAELEAWGKEDGSYVVGIGHESSQGGIGGHLVCVVEGSYVVDASLDQATSSTHGLRVPGVVAFPIDPVGLAHRIIRLVDSALFVEYVVEPVDVEYTASPDWGNTPEVREAVERILAHMDSMS